MYTCTHVHCTYICVCIHVQICIPHTLYVHNYNYVCTSYVCTHNFNCTCMYIPIDMYIHVCIIYTCKCATCPRLHNYGNLRILEDCIIAGDIHVEVFSPGLFRAVLHHSNFFSLFPLMWYKQCTKPQNPFDHNEQHSILLFWGESCQTSKRHSCLRC